MEKFSASLALKLVLLLASLVLVISDEKDSLNNQSSSTRKVRIYNDLKGNVTLWTHCRGPGRDLGKQEIIRGHMEWEFEEEIEGFPKTFKCQIKWNQKEQVFKAYSTARDKGRCKLKCWWSIRDDCAYSWNESKNQYEPLYCWSNWEI